MQLGLVTYNLAKDWDLNTLLANCEATGFEAVELRTTHAHGVELTLDASARRQVRARFEDSPVRLWGLGTTCEYDSPDAATVQRNVEETRRWIELAADVGAAGVKVRPNRLHEDVPPEQTCQQIGEALQSLGPEAEAAGVELWLEVHGSGTQHPARIHDILAVATHPAVGACWNSNFNEHEVQHGSIEQSFSLLAGGIRSCHITELAEPAYPWRELFWRLKDVGYDRPTLAEIQGSADALRLMRYYRALWQAYQPPA